MEKQSDGSGEEGCQLNSENATEIEKFIRKLEIQRSVLNKLVGSEHPEPTDTDNIDQECSDPD